MSTAPYRRASLFALVSCFAATLHAQSMMTQGPAVSPSGARAPAGICGNVSFTQNTSTVVAAGNSLTCAELGTNYHNENHWWRAFRLGESGVEGDLDVCAVEIGSLHRRLGVRNRPAVHNQPVSELRRLPVSRRHAHARRQRDDQSDRPEWHERRRTCHGNRFGTVGARR